MTKRTLRNPHLLLSLAAVGCFALAGCSTETSTEDDGAEGASDPNALTSAGSGGASHDAVTPAPNRAARVAQSTRDMSLPAGMMRYIVKYKDVPKGKSAVALRGGAVALDLPFMGASAVHLAPSEVDALRNDAAVEYVEEDVPRFPMAQTTPYGIPMVQANLVSAASNTNRTVCIIDSGLKISHEDHAGNPNISGTNMSGTGAWNDDTCGHGTHVAGTIAAVDNSVGVIGVAPGFKLHIVKVFDGESCAWTYTSTLVNALNACRNAGANIVSMSLGGGRSSNTEKNAFANAEAAGVLSIAAAGNAGNTTLSYPASYSSVVSVAAIDSNKVVADFSQKNSQVELAAPGVAVQSTVPWLDTATLEVGGNTYSGHHVDFAARGTATGALANGGLCDSTNAGWAGKVVLCQRGTVSFATKVLNVQGSGGVAAVIYNNVAGDLFATLDPSTSTIPAIGVTQADGEAALGSVGSPATVTDTHNTSGSGYEAWDGTSMATPHVSGVAALVWSNHLSWTNKQLRAALTATAEDLGVAGRDNSYGYGLVRAQAANAYVPPTCKSGGAACTSSSQCCSNVCRPNGKCQ
jgi:subtilisin family serine protease